MNILQQLIDSIHAVIRNKGIEPIEIDAATKLDSALGFDSLDYAELVVRLHGALHVDPFSSGCTFDIVTVGDLAALYEKAAGGAGPSEPA